MSTSNNSSMYSAYTAGSSIVPALMGVVVVFLFLFVFSCCHPESAMDPELVFFCQQWLCTGLVYFLDSEGAATHTWRPVQTFVSCLSALATLREECMEHLSGSL